MTCKSKATPPSKLEGDPAPPLSSQGAKQAREQTGNKENVEIVAKPINGGLDHTNYSSQPSSPASFKQSLKRPYLRSRSSNGSLGKGQDDSEGPTQNGTTGGSKGPPVKPTPQRKGSWISSISSKFSSTPPASPNPSKDASGSTKQASASPHVELHNPFNSLSQPATKEESSKEVSPANQNSTASKGGHPSFLQNALRKLSSSGATGLGKFSGSGSPAQRRVMNVDQNRERCRIPDLDQAKLRRVSFCVDVEIAGFARYPESEQEESTGRRPSLTMLEQQVKANKKKDAKEAKAKDVGEGAALKSPDVVTEEKEAEGVVHANEEAVGTSADPKPEGDLLCTNGEAPTKKKEKKKRTEAERKERRERKRRQAEESGTIPMELTRDPTDDDSSSTANSPLGSATPVPQKIADRPTTDPLRIYKRCAQLRETAALKKICDQISSPSCKLAESPGTVAMLDLTGYSMDLQDIITLGDWLAVVPVRKLILEDCGLTDEAVRVILSGLLGCKTAEQAKHNKKLAKRKSDSDQHEEELGIVQKISLKNNPKLTKIGWKHVGLFMHMSKSLKSIDLSGIPFPIPRQQDGAKADLCTLISKGLAERFGKDSLEELILNQCQLSTSNIGQLIDGALACGLRRLGLAGNDMDEDGLEHIIRYIKSGVCEGLDLGGNDLRGRLGGLAAALDSKNPLIAVSFADCNLEPSDLNVILPTLTQLMNFKFIDFSHNRALFATQPDALPILRRYLPQMATLKRIHMADVDMSPDHLIGLAEIFPETPDLAHVNVLENPRIQELMNAKDGPSQEEACALFASLMTAARISHGICAIDIEVPSADSNEVVKTLASQVVAYCLRNMERGPVNEATAGELYAKESDQHAPEILLHIVGSMPGYDDKVDEPAPDEDYVIGGTGVVKALGVCLGTAAASGRTSRDISPSGSGAATPRHKANAPTQKKPKEFSKQLLESARKIRSRLRPALVREDRLGNIAEYRKCFLV